MKRFGNALMPVLARHATDPATFEQTSFKAPLGSGPYVASEVKPGARITGEVLGRFDMSHEIDNMEGIDAHVTPEGDTVITMVSDDNFSMIQRNLLLQFTLVG